MVEKPSKDYTVHPLGVHASYRVDFAERGGVEGRLSIPEALEFSYVFPSFVARHLRDCDPTSYRSEGINSDAVSATQEAEGKRRDEMGDG